MIGWIDFGLPFWVSVSALCLGMLVPCIVADVVDHASFVFLPVVVVFVFLFSSLFVLRRVVFGF